MAITTIAEEKARYKQMLVDWFVSFFMVLFIHYFLVLVFNINDMILSGISKTITATNMTGFYQLMRDEAHSVKFTTGWYAAIAYLALVIMMVKFAWKYSKRLLSAYILVILSPMVAISYALDKIKDGRSQSLGRWLKEIAFTVLIQSAHALIYAVFMIGIVGQIVQGTDLLQVIGGIVFLIIAIGFMDEVEKIFETIFGFKKSEILGEVLDSSFEMFAKFKIAKTWTKRAWSFTKAAVRAPRKAIHFIGDYSESGRRAETKLYGRFDEMKQRYEAGKNGENPELKKPTMTGSEKLIELQRRTEAVKLKNRKKTVDKTRKALGSSVSNTAKGLSGLFNHPMAALTMFVAAGSSMKSFTKNVRRNISGFKNDTTEAWKERTVFTGKAKGKIELLNNIHEQDVKLYETTQKLFTDEKRIIVKGYKEDATPEEKQKAQTVEKILLHDLSEASRIFPKVRVREVYDEIILEETAAPKKTEREDKTSEIEVEQTKKAAKNNGVPNTENTNSNQTNNSETSALQMIDKTVDKLEANDKKLKVNKEEFHDNLKEELKRAMLDQVLGNENPIKVTFNEELQNSIKQIQREARSNTRGRPSKQAKIEKQRRAEEAIEAVIEDYLKDENNKNETIESLSVEDTSNMITRALNREGSIRRNYTILRNRQSDEIKKELKEYEPILNQAIELRNRYIDTIGTKRETTINVVKAIREGYSKIKK